MDGFALAIDDAFLSNVPQEFAMSDGAKMIAIIPSNITIIAYYDRHLDRLAYISQWTPKAILLGHRFLYRPRLQTHLLLFELLQQHQ